MMMAVQFAEGSYIESTMRSWLWIFKCGFSRRTYRVQFSIDGLVIKALTFLAMWNRLGATMENTVHDTRFPPRIGVLPNSNIILNRQPLEI